MACEKLAIQSAIKAVLSVECVPLSRPYVDAQSTQCTDHMHNFAIVDTRNH